MSLLIDFSVECDCDRCGYIDYYPDAWINQLEQEYYDFFSSKGWGFDIGEDEETLCPDCMKGVCDGQ